MRDFLILKRCQHAVVHHVSDSILACPFRLFPLCLFLLVSSDAYPVVQKNRGDTLPSCANSDASCILHVVDDCSQCTLDSGKVCRVLLDDFPDGPQVCAYSAPSFTVM